MRGRIALQFPRSALPGLRRRLQSLGLAVHIVPWSDGGGEGEGEGEGDGGGNRDGAGTRGGGTSGGDGSTGDGTSRDALSFAGPLGNQWLVVGSDPPHSLIGPLSSLPIETTPSLPGGPSPGGCLGIKTVEFTVPRGAAGAMGRSMSVSLGRPCGGEEEEG